MWITGGLALLPTGDDAVHCTIAGKLGQDAALHTSGVCPIGYLHRGESATTPRGEWRVAGVSANRFSVTVKQVQILLIGMDGHRPEEPNEPVLNDDRHALSDALEDIVVIPGIEIDTEPNSTNSINFRRSTPAIVFYRIRGK